MHEKTKSTLAQKYRDWTTGWILANLTRKPKNGKIRCALMIGVLAVFIGLKDYFAGVQVSLQLFYLIPVALAVVWTGWEGGCITAISCVVVRVVEDLAMRGTYIPIGVMLWNRSVDLAVYLVVIGIFNALFQLHRQLEERVRLRTEVLEQALADRKKLQSELFAVGRRERTLLGYELHDGLGQHLTATALAAQSLAENIATRGDRGAEDARVIVELIEQGIDQTRQIARGLLLTAIEPDKLLPELSELATTVNQQYRTKCVFTTHGNPRVSDTAVASHLYHIANEAVRNAVRHAEPAQLMVELASQDQCLVLTITDDGCGLPESKLINKGLGLKIMAHRAELIDGEFFVEPGISRGTRIRCVVPIKRETAFASNHD